MFVFAGIVGPFLSSFLDSAFVVLNRFGSNSYSELFRMRFFSNVLASFALVPLILSWKQHGFPVLSRVRLKRYVEGGLLIIGLLTVGIVSFLVQTPHPDVTPAFLYLPLPLLLWAAIRFGPTGSSTAIAVVSLFAIWGAIHDHGPFTSQSPEMNALSIQLFLIVASMPLMFLAAVIKEREQTQELALQKEERLTVALDAAQMGTWDWRVTDDYTDWSAQTKRIFGLSPADPPLPPEEFYSIIHENDQDRIRKAVEQAVVNGGDYEAEFRIPRQDGSVRWVRGVGKVVHDANGQPLRMMGVNVDITNRKRVEDQLQEASERNKAILRALPDLVFLLNREGTYLDYYAPEASQLFVSPELFIGKTVTEIMPSEVATEVMRCLARSGQEPQIVVYSLVINEEERHYEARIIKMEGDKFLSIVRDVTDREIATKRLHESQRQLSNSHKQIRNLLARLINVQESERRRISRELHDDLSQRMAILSVGISRLKKRLNSSDDSLVTELDALREQAAVLTNEIRRLSHQLHPAVLEHLGLVAALKSFIGDFRTEEQIDVSFSSDLGDRKISFPVSICMYRVAVEALRNVSRHSGASSAAVSLSSPGNFLELRVSDFGKGFELESTTKGAGLGLVSIEERLRLLHGSYEILSTPNVGTTLIARVPMVN
jgi:PAS domain S-box-containing protein